MEIAAFDFQRDVVQSIDNAVPFVFAQNADFTKHLGMGNGPLNIISGHPPIETDRSSEKLYESICRLREASTPGFVRVVCAHNVIPLIAVDRKLYSELACRKRITFLYKRSYFGY